DWIRSAAGQNHRPVDPVAPQRFPPKHRSASRIEPRTADRGSRKAKHGCFAREAGQDVLTGRKSDSRSAGRGDHLKPAPDEHLALTAVREAWPARPAIVRAQRRTRA